MRIVSFLALALACTPADDDKDTSGTLEADSGDPACEGTPPDITGFSVGEGDIYTDENGNEYPTLVMVVEFEDVDGDAHILSAKLWWDSTVDGSIDGAAEPDAVLDESAMISGGEVVEECEGEGGTLNISIPVSAADFMYSTQYDFGVTVIDANGYESEMAVATATTPADL
ncbi:MAG: hypothetical protein FJ102_08100 [Deltaproteobacteria bacterium]|nr:hypothetical protein [Deltaproteobacteria bacterium]